VAGPVTGLGVGAPVRLNGIDVGRVTTMALDPKDPRLVILLLQVRDNIEIHSDSVASIESQGLTGVSYVEISGGTLGSPLLVAAEGQKYPQIASRPSSLQEVFDNAPELLSRLLIIADRLEAVLDGKNRSAIAETLVNIRDTTGMLSRRSKDIDQLIADAGTTMHNLADSSATLKSTLANLDRTSGKADGLIASANTTFDHATKLATDLDSLVQSSRPGLRDLTTNGTTQLTELLSEARRLVASLNRVSTGLERDPSRLLLGDRHEGYQPK
jgi:phospholipid/cholesterol/gamma-HCH transport system substrate-binding protein